MNNLAGNDVSIFLFRFVLRKNAISFVLNESIAEDMYPDVEEQMQPFIHVCSETLLRYKKHCLGETIMDGNIMIDSCFEVQLSPGLGRHFIEREKQNLFNDAHEIAQLLMTVMDRRTKEMEHGTYPGPQPVINKIQRIGTLHKALHTLGQKRHLEDLPWHGNDRPSLNQLKSEDLPNDVVAKRSYDHRGHCISFEHKTLGELGRIILVGMDDGQTLMQAEISNDNPQFLNKKQTIFEDVVSIIEACFDKNL